METERRYDRDRARLEKEKYRRTKDGNYETKKWKQTEMGAGRKEMKGIQQLEKLRRNPRMKERSKTG